MKDNPPSASAAAATCMRLIGGYQVSRAIYAGVALGVFDALGESRDAGSLAVELSLHARSLYRLLRALASVGLLHEDDAQCFSLTPPGRLLRADVPGTLAPWALSIGRPYYWAAWSELPHSIETGEPAFVRAHGATAWDWRASHPDDAAVFNRAMTAMSQRLSRAIAMACDFSRFGCVVDVGGGTGSLLATLLRRHPAQRGVLFDLPEALSGADEALRAAGVDARVERAGGSFFERVPAGGDAYVLCSVLHNWADAHALQILRACRAAMHPDARLFVVESDVGPPNAAPAVKLLDLNMLVMHGAGERTVAELDRLLGDAGLARVDARPTAIGMTVTEARPL